MELEGIDNYAVALLVADVVADDRIVAFNVDEAVRIIGSADAFAVEGAVLDQRSDRTFLDVNMLSSNVRTKHNAANRVVMRVWIIACSVCRADIHPFAKARASLAGIMNIGILDCAVRGAITKMNRFIANVVHFYIRDKRMVGMIKQDALLSICEDHVANDPVIASHAKAEARAGRVAGEDSGVSGVLALNRNGCSFGSINVG